MQNDITAGELLQGHVIHVPGIRRPQLILSVMEMRVKRVAVVTTPSGAVHEVDAMPRVTVCVAHRPSVRGWSSWRDRLDRLAVWSGVLEQEEDSGVFIMASDVPVKAVVL